MSGAVEHDPVNHPRHYTSINGIECIDVVETKSFNVGNAIKYLWRAGEKDDIVQDLRKAVWYINREIERLNNGASPETPPAEEISGRPARPATIRIGRWDYEAEISGEGIASYENRAGDPVQAGPDRYKVIRYH